MGALLLYSLFGEDEDTGFMDFVIAKGHSSFSLPAPYTKEHRATTNRYTMEYNLFRK